MKKVVSILLAVLSVIALAVPTFAAAPLGYHDFDTVSKNSTTHNFIEDAKQDYRGINYCWYYDDQYGSESQIDNRGAGLGSSKQDVFNKFGKTSVSKVKNVNSNSFDVPVSKADYTYKKTGRIYHKTFYFDDENKVCYIEWWIS